MNSPLWATPGRRAKLAQLFLKEQAEFAKEFYNSLDLVVFGDLSISELADLLTRRHFCELIEAWKAQDRDERSTAWKYEKRHLHQGPNPGRRPFKRGPFDSIARAEYLANRPLWEIVAIGVGAFSHRRVAMVKLLESKQILWVEIRGKLNISKNKLRKLTRYHRGAIPKGMVDQMEQQVDQAVKRFLGN
jgi:hypothetical protein